MSTATSAPLRPAARPRSRAAFKSNDGRLRVADWAKLPETKPHYELIDGILQQKMPTRRRHSHAAAMLHFLLMQWGLEQGWMFYTEGTAVRADQFNGFIPDVSGFAPNVTLDPEAVYEQAPFLVAEVLSTSTAKDDRTTKMDGYAQAEVELYLLIDTKKRAVEVYRLHAGGYGAPETLRGDKVWAPAELPELRLDLARLWMPARRGK